MRRGPDRARPASNLPTAISFRRKPGITLGYCSKMASSHGARPSGSSHSMPTATRRQFLGAGTATMATVATATQRTGGSARRPNILYIHSHDTGRYTQPYGVSVPAPNLQRLAGESVLFRMAFSGAPTCSPSRAALLTGQCAHSSGMLGLAHRGFALNAYQQHIVHTLKPAGYTTVLAGLQHVAKDPEIIGYDKILPHQDTHAENVAPAAV